QPTTKGSLGMQLLKRAGRGRGRTPSRRVLSLRAVGAAALVGGLLTPLMGASAQAAEPQIIDWTGSGSYSLTVPASVSAYTIEVAGGAGGDGGGGTVVDDWWKYEPGIGGKGAVVRGVLEVSEGDVI